MSNGNGSGARVNLLPDEVGQRSRAGQQRILTGVLFLLLFVAIGGVWWWNEMRIDEREMDLADAEGEVAMLRAEVVELQPFADLEARADAGATLLQTTLGGEVSFAGVLQDLSSTLPPNAQFDSLSVTVTDPRTPVPGGERLVLGTVSASGQLLLGVAPGAERVLIDVGRSAAFDNIFITTTETEDAFTYTLELELGPEVLTERYGVETEVAP